MCEEGIDEKKEEEYLNRRLKRRKERRFLEEESVRDKMREDNGTTEEIEAWPIYSVPSPTPPPSLWLYSCPFSLFPRNSLFFFFFEFTPKVDCIRSPFLYSQPFHLPHHMFY